MYGLSKTESIRVTKALPGAFLSHNSIVAAEQIIWLGAKVDSTALDLNLLVYLSHGWMLGIHDRPLIDEPVEAWTHGPVLPSIYYFHEHYRILKNRSRSTEFTTVQNEVMIEVTSEYSDCTTSELSAITKEPGSPWSATWYNCEIGSVIRDDTIKAFYGTYVAKSAPL